jgi:hypothetical protein
MSKRYVVINNGTHTREDESLPIDTAEEIEAALTAMTACGQWSARIYAGDTNDPDSYPTGQRLYAHETNDHLRMPNPEEY